MYKRAGPSQVRLAKTLKNHQKTIKKTIYKFKHIEVKTLKDILSVDFEARLLTNKIIKN